MRAVLVIVTLAALTGRALADECADARGAMKQGDLVRAQLHGCAAIDGDLEARAEQKGWSPVEIVTEPDGGTVIVASAPELPFRAPRKLWLPPGDHELTALVDGAPVVSVLVILKDGNRALARLELPVASVEPAGDGAVDFGEEGGAGDVARGPPPKQEFDSLLPARYRKGLAAEGEGGAGVERTRRLRIAAGGIGIFGHGTSSWGAIGEVSYRIAAGAPRAALVPAIGGWYVDGHAGGIASVTFQGFFGPVSIGGGPAAALAEESGIGVVGVAGVARGAIGVDLRADYLIGAHPSAALLVGLRW
jgi:hypothetical protein